MVAKEPQTLVRSRKSKSRIKSSTIAVYASIFVLLIVLIAIGYRTPQQVSGVANTASVPTLDDDTDSEAVNDVVASSIAANVATTTNLSVAPSVTSLAISTQIESELPTSDNSTISKPQIIQVSAAGRSIVKYTVQAGDTTETIAAKYSISKDTLKWANNLVYDVLTVGQSLDILPRDGIIYVVKSGDSIQGLADKYKSDANLITSYNDLEISGISAGLKIIIPGGQLPANERPGYAAPVSTGSLYAGFRSGSVGNKYAYGYCTWYVYERRAAIGRPIGSFWGDAGSWKASGEASGYRVDKNPEAGAILVELGRPGHVAFVEAVTETGDVILKEMNNSAYGGWGRVSGRTLSAGQAALYWYVH